MMTKNKILLDGREKLKERYNVREIKEKERKREREREGEMKCVCVRVHMTERKRERDRAARKVLIKIQPRFEKAIN